MFIRKTCLRAIEIYKFDFILNFCYEKGHFTYRLQTFNAFFNDDSSKIANKTKSASSGRSFMLITFLLSLIIASLSVFLNPKLNAQNFNLNDFC